MFLKIILALCLFITNWTLTLLSTKLGTRNVSNLLLEGMLKVGIPNCKLEGHIYFPDFARERPSHVAQQ